MPSGDPPDGTETTIRGNENGLFAAWLSAVRVGGSPTGAGESPAPPIFQTRSQSGQSEPYPQSPVNDGCPILSIAGEFRPPANRHPPLASAKAHDCLLVGFGRHAQRRVPAAGAVRATRRRSCNPIRMGEIFFGHIR